MYFFSDFILRIEVKQRNFEDLMYDLQSLQEKNGRLKDRVRKVAYIQGLEGGGGLNFESWVHFPYIQVSCSWIIR